MSAEHEMQNEMLSSALSECAAGNKAAFKTVYNITHDRFYAIILKMVRDEDLALDVLQKAYLSIWKSAGRYDPARAKAFTWMLVVMRNRAIDVLRSRKYVSTEETLEETLIDNGARPDQQAQMGHLKLLLDKHLGQLPARMATAIALNIQQGWTCREIGEFLDVSPNTVKSWIRRGLKKLNTSLPFETLGEAI